MCHGGRMTWSLLSCEQLSVSKSKRMTFWRNILGDGRVENRQTSTVCTLVQQGLPALPYQQAEPFSLIALLGMEKAMAPHSSTLAWKIPWMEEPGRLQSMGSLGVRHDWATSLWLFTLMHWRRKWQPTPVFLPGESHGQRSLVGCRLWGCTESDTTEAT